MPTNTEIVCRNPQQVREDMLCELHTDVEQALKIRVPYILSGRVEGTDRFYRGETRDKLKIVLNTVERFICRADTVTTDQVVSLSKAYHRICMNYNPMEAVK